MFNSQGNIMPLRNRRRSNMLRDRELKRRNREAANITLREVEAVTPVVTGFLINNWKAIKISKFGFTIQNLTSYAVRVFTEFHPEALATAGRKATSKIRRLFRRNKRIR